MIRFEGGNISSNIRDFCELGKRHIGGVLGRSKIPDEMIYEVACDTMTGDKAMLTLDAFRVFEGV